MRNWLFAALGAAGLLATGIGAASAAPPSERAMMDRPPTAHTAPNVHRTDYEWRHHRYQHRRWEHNHWRYWD